MSRYFKYKSSHSLLADARELGLDFHLTDDLSPLLRPISVGGRVVGNRLAIQPMEGCDAELDGSPGELTFRRFRRFGAGGAKLIWGEACAVVPEGRANPRQLVINSANAFALARIVSETRAAHVASNGSGDDLLLGLQLTHSGRFAFQRPVLAEHDPLLDPRTVIDKATGTTAGPDSPLISDAELDRLQDRYVEAGQAGVSRRFRFRRHQAVPPLSLERAPGRSFAPGQVWRPVRESNAIHPRGRQTNPRRLPWIVDRHPVERL